MGSIVGECCVIVPGFNIGTLAGYPGFYNCLTLNLFDGLPEETGTHHNLQNQERLRFAHELAAHAGTSRTFNSSDQNLCNSHAMTPAEGPHISYLHHQVVKFSDINMQTSIGSEIMRDEQSTAIR
jgi:hypothetical protein